MTTSRQESPNADQLWAGEIKLTLHVSKDLTPSEERQLAANVSDLTEKFKALAEAALPQGCRIDAEVG